MCLCKFWRFLFNGLDFGLSYRKLKIDSVILVDILEKFPTCLEKIPDRWILCKFEIAKIIRFYGHIKKIDIITKQSFNKSFELFQNLSGIVV